MRCVLSAPPHLVHCTVHRPVHRPVDRIAARTAAHCEQALGRLRLGVSRLSNFGALHAAGLRVEEAAGLLRTAQALRTQAGEAEAEDGVPAVLSAIEQARREMGEWAEITASLGAGGEAVAGAAGESGGEGGSWRVAPLFARAAELPRRCSGGAADGQRRKARRACRTGTRARSKSSAVTLSYSARVTASGAAAWSEGGSCTSTVACSSPS